MNAFTRRRGIVRYVSLILFLSALPCFASRILTDEFGRRVTVPDHPHRLICLVPSVVDDVYAIGAGNDVVGISDYTKYPAEAKLKPSIGQPLNPSIETILSLHPDLVLGSGGLNHIEIVNRLQQYGIPVFMVNPHGIEGIYLSIESIGRALNREGEAEDLVRRLRGREQAVRRRVRGQTPLRVFMPVGYDPIISVGKNAFITQLIEAAGGISVTGDIAQEWPQVSLEAVIARQPDALLLVRGSQMSLQSLKARPGWDILPAVKSARVFYVDDRIDFPSPVAIDALEELAAQFHP